MKPCLKSLRSLVIALGLGVFAMGCIAESQASADAVEATPGVEAQSVEGTDEATGDTNGTAPDEDGEDAAGDDEQPGDPTSPDGLCTSPSCAQV